ncbi:MAG TPA: pilus assembly protein PilM [Candidatus Saccharimonadales bacterium]|nr:pilus assembly protein PilM [Candidatus Saccharimonadales bacterium]
MGLPFISREAKKHDQIVAIDLGSRSTKAVHLQRKGERFNLIGYSIMDAPGGDKGPSPEAMIEHLRGVTEELKVNRGRPVTLSLGVADSMIRQVEVPMMPAADIRQMLKFNSKTYLQQDLSDHVFDCYCLPLLSASAERPAPGDGKPAEPAKAASIPTKMRAIVGGAKKQLVDGWATAVRGAGLAPESIFPGMLGPTNAFELCEPELYAKEVIALVDIGFKNTTVSILQAGEMMLNRVVAIGGDHITNGLVEAMNISYAEAEGIKIGMPTEVQENLETILNPLGRELRASIDFFEHQHDKTVTQVLLSGGSARCELIVQCLQTELMVACRSWNPAKFLELALAPEKMGEIEQVAPQLTVAIGAATSIF